jgi:membrane protease YdiL (CAAX protease family)
MRDPRDGPSHVGSSESSVVDRAPDEPPGVGLLPRVLVVLVLALVASFVGTVLLRPPPGASGPGVFVRLVLGSEIALAGAAAVVLLTRDLPGDLGLRRRPDPLALLGYLASALVLGAAAVAVTAILLDGSTSGGPIVGTGADAQASAVLLATVPLSVLAIAPAEELFFRGFAQRYLASATDSRRAILAAAGLFTLVHLPQYLLVDSVAAGGLLLGLVFLVGAGAGLVYERSGSLLAAIALHATYNCVIAGVWWAELEYGVLSV